MRSCRNSAERRPAARRFRDPLAATSESNRIDRGRTAGTGGVISPRPWRRHARRDADSRHQAVSVERSAGTVAAGVAGGSRNALRSALTCGIIGSTVINGRFSVIGVLKFVTNFLRPHSRSARTGILGALILTAFSAVAQSPGAFIATGSMVHPRLSHTATLLNDGRVLITGGFTYPAGNEPLRQAELYDPATGTFSPTGSMSIARSWATATLLPDGRVLIAGGYESRDLATAEIYDPATETFSATGNMAAARRGHSATLLSNGRVLINGGGQLGGGKPEFHCPGHFANPVLTTHNGPPNSTSAAPCAHRCDADRKRAFEAGEHSR
jgi:Kelch motif